MFVYNVERTFPERSQISSKLMCVWILTWETTADALYHWRKRYYELWTHILDIKNILMLDLFHLLSSPDVNWWTGVVWIIVMFLSDSHSDGTHSLPLLRHWCRDTFIQTWWRNKLRWLLFDQLLLLSASHNINNTWFINN